jgi:hypothetical protein
MHLDPLGRVGRVDAGCALTETCAQKALGKEAGAGPDIENLACCVSVKKL